MTTTKQFSGVFGNKYELDILSEQEIDNIIEDIDQEEVLETLLRKHSRYNSTEAYLNVSTGEIEYYSFIGNTDLQEKGHLILLESISGNEDEGLEVEDFLDEKEIEQHEGEPLWDVIKDLSDYQERLVDAWKFYYRGFQMGRIEERIQEIYNPEF